MLIFGIVVFVRVSFARANRREVFGVIVRRAISFGGSWTWRLVIARAAAAAAPATAASTGSFVLGLGISTRNPLINQLGVMRFALFSRSGTRSRACRTIGSAARTPAATAATAARTLTRRFAFAGRTRFVTQVIVQVITQ
jgi:hypothetical protein